MQQTLQKGMQSIGGPDLPPKVLEHNRAAIGHSQLLHPVAVRLNPVLQALCSTLEGLKLLIGFTQTLH